jgi:hypothetical protein
MTDSDVRPESRWTAQLCFNRKLSQCFYNLSVAGSKAQRW